MRCTDNYTHKSRNITFAAIPGVYLVVETRKVCVESEDGGGWVSVLPVQLMRYDITRWEEFRLKSTGGGSPRS